MVGERSVNCPRSPDSTKNSFCGSASADQLLIEMISGLSFYRRNPQKGKEAAAPSNIKEIQGGQEAPHNGGAINPKDA